MPKTVISNQVYRAVKNGPVAGLAPTIEPQPNGDNLITLRRPSQVPNRNRDQVERKYQRLLRTPFYTEQQARAQANLKSSEPHAVAVPQEMASRMFTDLPTEIRRTARQRYQELLRTLWSDAELTFYKDGEIRWPASIKNEIGVLGLAQGKANLADQVEALARRFLIKGARDQQAQDARRVTRDWHGHLSA